MSTKGCIQGAFYPEGPTHILALRIRGAAVIDHITAAQERVAAAAPPLRSFMVNPARLHFTLCPLRLRSPMLYASAVAAVRGILSSGCLKPLENSSKSIRLGPPERRKNGRVLSCPALGDFIHGVARELHTYLASILPPEAFYGPQEEEPQNFYLNLLRLPTKLPKGKHISHERLEEIKQVIAMDIGDDVVRCMAEALEEVGDVGFDAVELLSTVTNDDAGAMLSIAHCNFEEKKDDYVEPEEPLAFKMKTPRSARSSPRMSPREEKREKASPILTPLSLAPIKSPDEMLAEWAEWAEAVKKMLVAKGVAPESIPKTPVDSLRIDKKKPKRGRKKGHAGKRIGTRSEPPSLPESPEIVEPSFQ